MASQGAILEHLVLSMLLNGTGASEKKNQIGLGLAALSFFLALAGLGFLMAAGYGFLQDRVDNTTATLYMACVTLGLAIGGLITSYALFSYRQRRIKSYHRQLTENIHLALTDVIEELEEPIRENPKTAAALAGLAGFVAAQKFM